MKRFRLLWGCIFLAESLAAQGFQVLITELLPDPVPSIGLPAAEFVELTNVSGKTVDLSGWWLSNGRSRGILPDSLLLPADSVLIVCSRSAAPDFTQYGRTISLERFPSLGNVNDTIVLFDSGGALVHAVAYTLSDYGSQDAMSGRSIEMVRLQDACSLNGNWLASEQSIGGSPGKYNQFTDPPESLSGFDLSYVYPEGDSALVLVFNDRLRPDALNLIPPVSPSLAVKWLSWNNFLQNQIRCELKERMQPGTLYTISLTNFFSCLGTRTGGPEIVRFGIPAQTAKGIVINEILFDPPAAGSDYVELLHTGDSIIDLQTLKISNRSSDGKIGAVKSLSTGSRIVCKGDYLVFTTQPDWLRQHYLIKNPRSLVKVPELPSWPNSRGSVILLEDSSILDEVDYDDHWHVPLLTNTEGISLERINPLAPSQEPTNWHSAAMSSGYGTPGYENSQSMAAPTGKWKLWAEPILFTPNGDGLDDVCRINYQFSEPGAILTTAIYNRNGQLVCYLARNALCGQKGQFSWEGHDERGRRLAPDLYVILTEVFTPEGKTRRFRQAVTIGY